MKTFEIKVQVLENNTPQNWTFSADISGIEQLALCMIVKELADKNINQLLNKTDPKQN